MRLSVTAPFYEIVHRLRAKSIDKIMVIDEVEIWWYVEKYDFVRCLTSGAYINAAIAPADSKSYSHPNVFAQNVSFSSGGRVPKNATFRSNTPTGPT
jgi:hypothetical protein